MLSNDRGPILFFYEEYLLSSSKDVYLVSHEYREGRSSTFVVVNRHHAVNEILNEIGMFPEIEAIVNL